MKTLIFPREISPALALRVKAPLLWKFKTTKIQKDICCHLGRKHSVLVVKEACLLQTHIYHAINFIPSFIQSKAAFWGDLTAELKLKWLSIVPLP